MRETYLVSAPLHAGHEQDHADDAQEPADEIYSVDHFLLVQSNGVDSWRREVEQDGDQEPETVPCATKGTDIAPAAVGCDELGPEYGWAEREDGKDQDRNVFASFSGRCHF